MNKKYLVYIVKCKTTGMRYVGATTQKFSVRWSQHLRKARTDSRGYLHNSILAHGVDSFYCEKVIECDSREAMFKKEKEIIKNLDTMAPKGYNLNIGGQGIKPTASSKEKQSISAKKYHACPAFKAKHKAAVIVAKSTPEARLNQSKARKGKKMHPNSMQACIDAKRKPEYHAVGSAAAKKTWAQEGYKEKWTASKLEKHIAKASRFPLRGDGLVFSSTRSAAVRMKQEGYDKAAPNNICLACNGKYKSSYGHAWSWVDGDEARLSGVVIL